MKRLRPRLRRLLFGLSTVTGLAERGFFIPYRYAARLPRAGTRPPYPAMERLLADAAPRFRQVLAAIDRHGAALAALGGEPPAPRWNQRWFPRLDAAAAYVLTRSLLPQRIVEVGAGHSTRFFARALADAAITDSRITAIDPKPRADLHRLPVRLLRTTLQEAGPAPFAGLAAGDLLSIDSSHILMPGSDLDVLLGRILPGLPPGLLLQVHDVFLPDDYPADWAWRGYNEQLALLPLLYSGGWEPLWSSHYVTTRLTAEVAASAAGRLPLPEGAVESSLWLRRSGGPPLTQI